MDKEAPSAVIKGTLITSAASAFFTGLYGIATKNAKYGFLAGAAAINSGVTAATFFGIREFAVSPLLVSSLPWPQYVRRRREIGISREGDNENRVGQVSWSDLRKHKTLDTGISGTIAGGVLRGWKSGPKAILPGALTVGAICTILQVTYNELGVMRLRYISRLDTADSLGRAPTSPIAKHSAPGVLEKPITERILTTLGLKEVSDDEYLAKLKNTREAHLKRIAELELELETKESDKNVP